MNKKVFVFVDGCVLIQLENEKIKEAFENIGWTVVNSCEEADRVIYNTCAYSGDKIDETLRNLKQLESKKKKEAELIVMGCLPKIDMESLRKVFKGNTADITAFGLDNLYISGNIVSTIHPASRQDMYQIVISTGCSGECSFCAVKRAKGSVRSRPVIEVMGEFEKALDLGFRKIALWSEGLGDYGEDISVNLIELIRSMIDSQPHELKYSLFLYRLSPRETIKYFEGFKELVRTEKIRLISLSIQSGSNRLLKLMNRGHTVEDTKRCTTELRQEFSGLRFMADVMVGFPTETDDDFKATLEMLQEMDFDSVRVFPYSGVTGTPSFSMEGQVSEKIKSEREEVLSELVRSPIYRANRHNEIYACE